MLFSREINEWENIQNGINDIEFDYVAIDKLGQLAVLSTFNRGYKPKKVTESYDSFLALDMFLEELPKLCDVIKKIKSEGIFDDWKKYAELGFYAYDNQDVHRSIKLDQYDLIYEPNVTLNIESQIGFKKFESIIPRFDLVFGEILKFKQLEKSLIL